MSEENNLREASVIIQNYNPVTLDQILLAHPELSRCSECNKELGFKNRDDIGFACETFLVCKSCNKQVEDDWAEFQIEMKPEIDFLNKHSPFCKMCTGDDE